MTISVQVLNDQIKKISKTNSLLDMLIEFERVLENLNIYAYKNWIKGEILEGPHLNRHFICVKLMYKEKDMPDPNGAKRLFKRGCSVKYTKNTLLSPVKVQSIDDIETEIKPDGRTKIRAKTKSEPIWVVDIMMPRRYVDEYNLSQLDIDDNDNDESEAAEAENVIGAEMTDQYMYDDQEQF